MIPRTHKRSQIQGLYTIGLSIRQLSRELGVGRNTVRRWIRRNEGDVKDIKRTGRPRKLTVPAKNLIRETMKDKVSCGVRKMAKILNNQQQSINDQITVSQMTVSRHLRRTEWGKISYRQPLKPLLSAKNINDRINFCNRVRADGFCDDSREGKLKRAHVLFTDESPVELFPKPNRQNRRMRTANPQNIPPIQIPKFSLKIMIAGGINRYGKTELVIIDEKTNVNGDYYRERILPTYANALAHNFPEPNNVVLMQDGAKCHTAHASIAKCRVLFKDVWVDWPGNSPDLNPIEHIWARIQDAVLVAPRPRNRQDLIIRVQEAWRGIPVAECKTLIESFPRRIAECLEKNGKHTHY